MKTLDEAIEFVVDNMVHQYYSGANGIQTPGVGMIAFIFGKDVKSVENECRHRFEQRFKKKT